MADAIAIAFYNQRVTAAIGTVAKNGLRVKKMFSMSEAELDELLTKKNFDNFIVVGDCRSIYQEIILLPAVDPKLLTGLVANELRKLHKDLGDHSFFHQIIGDSLQDGKKFVKIACFVYLDSEVEPLLSRFVSHGKSVKCLYNSSYAISRLVRLTEGIENETVLCIADLADDKNLFLMQNGQVYFIRDIQSEGIGFTPLDIQNINMTIYYCFQSLRMRPTKALVVNSACSLGESDPKVMLPVASLPLPAGLGVSEEEMRNYCLPIAALLCRQEPEACDLLPRSYKTYFSQKALLLRGTALLMLLIFAALAGIGAKTFAILGNGVAMDYLRTEVKKLEKQTERFHRSAEQLNQLTPLITYINATNATPGMQKILLSLQCLRARDCTATSIIISRKEEGISIQAHGVIAAARLTDMQSTFERLVAELKAGGMEIVSQRIDPKNRSYQIETMKKT